MLKFLTRTTDVIRKHPFGTINIIMFIWYAIFMAILLAVLFTHNVPPELKTTTGTIASFKNHDMTDPDVIDYIINDTSSYLDIRLTNGESYRVSGIAYGSIDQELFTVMAVGSEIKLTYEDRGIGGGADWVYGIEQNGKTYLSVDDALSELKSERKITVIVCPVIMGVLTVLVGIGFIFNYRKFYRKAKETDGAVS